MSGFNFGTSQPSLFGTGGTSTSTGFGFGGTTSTAPTGFGFGSTGTTTTASTGFGFGTGTTTSAPGFGFGTTGTASTGFGFGTTPASTASTGFGFGFGNQPKTTASTGFGFGFGTTTTASTGFGFGTTTTASTGFGFGTTTTASTGFGFPSAATNTGIGSFGFGGNTGLGGQQQVPQQDPSREYLANMAQAISMPQIFGDERDTVIARWNQVQALWGFGKGYLGPNRSVEFKPDNPFCRFKAVGYSCMPSGKNEDGLVTLYINQPVDKVKSCQQQALDTINKALGNLPQMTVCAEAVLPHPDNMTELVIYVMERPQMGAAKRIPSLDVYRALTDPKVKPTLTSMLNIKDITHKVMTKDQLKQYLDNPPAGLNPLLWQQGILDNPDPEKLIPVPMMGFKELHRRLKIQEHHTKLHQQRLDLISGDLTDFQNKQGNMLAKLEEYKRKHLELSHRVLQVIVKQEIYRKQGFGIQADEEQLRVQLETLQAELNHPTQFKGRLNELMSQIRMQNHLASSRAEVNYQMDPSMQQEIKHGRLNELMSQIRMQNHLASSRAEVNYQMDPSMQQEIKHLLKQQQEGLQHLIEITKEDMQDLNVIEQGLTDTAASRR